MSDLPALRWKVEEKSSVVREFFLKKHRNQGSNLNLPEDRTAVVLNIPPYVTEGCLRNCLSPFGNIETLSFYDPRLPQENTERSSEFFTLPVHEPIMGYKASNVIFRSPKALQKLLAYAARDHTPLIISDADHPIETGINLWVKEHQKPLLSLVDLKKEIDAYMEQYDAKVEEEKRETKQAEGEADEEGWITVTRVGKKKVTRQTDVMTNKAEAAAKQKNADKELLNFYRFQKREGHTKELTDLRQKFEEDKQRIAQLKASRKFKPY